MSFNQPTIPHNAHLSISDGRSPVEMGCSCCSSHSVQSNKKQSKFKKSKQKSKKTDDRISRLNLFLAGNEGGKPTELGNREDNGPKIKKISKNNHNNQSFKSMARHDLSMEILNTHRDKFVPRLHSKRPLNKREKKIGLKGLPAMYMCGQYSLADTVGEKKALELGLAKDVEVVRDCGGGVRYRNVYRCNSPACPICSPIRSAKLRETVAKVGEAIKDKGGHLSFLTLTVQHFKRDSLEDLGDLLHSAYLRFSRDKRLKKRMAELLGLFEGFCSVSNFKVMEILWGSHGWHPHYHIAYFHPNKLTDEALEELRNLVQSTFEKALKTEREARGLEEREISDKATHFVAIDDDDMDDSISEYLTKEGVQGGFDWELTAGMFKNDIDVQNDLCDDEIWLKSLNGAINKRLKKKGVTFVGVLDIVGQYQKIAETAKNPSVIKKANEKVSEWSERYLDFTHFVFANRKLSRFSKGLKPFCGIDDKEGELDDELAVEVEEIEGESFEPIAVSINGLVWSYIFDNGLRLPLLKVVAEREIKQLDVVRIIDVVERAYFNRRHIDQVKNWLARIVFEHSYQPFGEYIEDLSLEDYRAYLEKQEELRRMREEERVNSILEDRRMRKKEENKQQRMAFARKYVADSSLSRIKRPVCYPYGNKYLYRSEIEVEFADEIKELLTECDVIQSTLPNVFDNSPKIVIE